MTKFIGEYNAKLDDKGRMVFPAAFKAQLGGECGKFVIKKDLYADCLEMFTYEEWEKNSEEVKSRLNFFNAEDERFWRGYTSNRAIVEPDEKLSRILIPKSLLDSIGISKDVVFFGSDHKIEIWSKEKYDAQKISNEDFVELAKSILGTKREG
jgi:MraZ protein